MQSGRVGVLMKSIVPECVESLHDEKLLVPPREEDGDLSFFPCIMKGVNATVVPRVIVCPW